VVFSAAWNVLRASFRLGRLLISAFGSKGAEVQILCSLAVRLSASTHALLPQVADPTKQINK
jgi:hypothetical protein